MISRREFLERFKHAGLVGIMGLGFIGAAGSSQAGFWDFAEAYASQEIAQGRKIVWENASRNRRLERATINGFPYVNSSKCAFSKILENRGYVGYYCWAPCTRYCPVRPRAIMILPQPPPQGIQVKLRPHVYTWNFHAPETILKQLAAGDKLGYPKVNYDLCIRCRKCFWVCGYNAIEWIESGERIQESSTDEYGSMAGEWEGYG